MGQLMAIASIMTMSALLAGTASGDDRPQWGALGVRTSLLLTIAGLTLSEKESAGRGKGPSCVMVASSICREQYNRP
jgi:hypothetical protein